MARRSKFFRAKRTRLAAQRTNKPLLKIFLNTAADERFRKLRKSRR